jgi:hypothetical protein
MGILDDAIREHLELKRAHGATEDEVRRQEAEVFGALRQETAAPGDQTELLGHAEPAEDADSLRPVPEDEYEVHRGDHAVPDAHDHAHEGGADPAWREDTDFFADTPRGDARPAAEAGAGTLEPSHGEAGPPAAPLHHNDEQHPALVDDDHIGREEHPPEPVFGHAAEAPTAPPPVEEPPVVEPPVEIPEIEDPLPPEPPEEPRGDEEDVLEETPEFLQDAPEHDRLWFEQKPPRDFDFGE